MSFGSLVGRRLALAAFLSVATLALISLGKLSHPPFSPDSWSYYELARSVSDDFYRVSAFRQYQFPGEYSTSFPPLWPVLIFLVDSITGLGIYSGYLTNILIAAITLVLLVQFSRQRFGTQWIGFLLFAALLANPEYIDELVAARSFPMAILLLILSINLLWEEDPSVRQLVVIGSLAGLGVLVRFDYLPAALATAIVVAYHLRSLRKGILVAICALVFMSPWILYSWSHFGKVFLSDNRRTALSAVPSFVTDFYPPGQEPPSLWDAPATWTRSLLQKATWHVLGTGRYFLRPVSWWAWVVPVVLHLLLTAWRERLRHWVRNRDRFGSYVRQAVLHPPAPVRITLIIGAQQAAVALTGYRDYRYLIPVYLAVTLFGLLLLRWRDAADIDSEVTKWLPFIFAAIVLVSMPTRTAVANLGKGWPPSIAQNHLRPTEYDEILRVRTVTDGPFHLLISDDKKPWKLAALTGLSSYLVPRNLGPANVRQFVQAYQITHLYTDDPALRALVGNVTPCMPVSPSVCRLSVP